MIFSKSPKHVKKIFFASEVHTKYKKGLDFGNDNIEKPNVPLVLKNCTICLNFH